MAVPASTEAIPLWDRALPGMGSGGPVGQIANDVRSHKCCSTLREVLESLWNRTLFGITVPGGLDTRRIANEVHSYGNSPCLAWAGSGTLP